MGASVGLVIGNPTAGNGDSFHAVGVSRHLGIVVTYDAANGGKPKSLEINLGISTPTIIPITVGGDTKVIQE